MLDDEGLQMRDNLPVRLPLHLRMCQPPDDVVVRRRRIPRLPDVQILQLGQEGKAV